MEALYGPGKVLGFEPFFEKSLTSQFLQILDQINKACHDAYKEGKKEYKQQHMAKYNVEPDIGVPEFLEIFGGCKELNLAGIKRTLKKRLARAQDKAAQGTTPKLRLCSLQRHRVQQEDSGGAAEGL